MKRLQVEAKNEQEAREIVYNGFYDDDDVSVEIDAQPEAFEVK